MTFDLCTGWRRRAGAVDTLWRVTTEAEAHAVERINRHVGPGGLHDAKRCGAGNLAPRELQSCCGLEQHGCESNKRWAHGGGCDK